MSDKEDTSLVPRPSGELVRIPPRASAIIDDMVNDATDIIRTRDADRRGKTGSRLDIKLNSKQHELIIVIVWFSVEAGVRKFGDVAQVVLREVGGAARPYLKMWYNGVRYYPGMESIAQEMDNDETIDAWLAQSPVPPPSPAQDPVDKVGFDPEIRRLGRQLADFYLEADARKFDSFAQRVLDNLGKTAHPYLKMWYNVLRNYPGMESIAQEMDNDETIDAWLAQSPAPPVLTNQNTVAFSSEPADKGDAG